MRARLFALRVLLGFWHLFLAISYSFFAMVTTVLDLTLTYTGFYWLSRKVIGNRSV